MNAESKKVNQSAFLTLPNQISSESDDDTAFYKLSPEQLKQSGIQWSKVGVNKTSNQMKIEQNKVVNTNMGSNYAS